MNITLIDDTHQVCMISVDLFDADGDNSGHLEQRFILILLLQQCATLFNQGERGKRMLADAN